MSGCLGSSGDLLGIIRAVKFSISQTGEQSRSQGKASIGSQLEAQLTGANALPEIVSFSVPVFANPLVPVVETVTCTLDVDEMNAKFSLQPVPLDIDRAIAAAEIEVGVRIENYIKSNKLDAATFVVLAGRPE